MADICTMPYAAHLTDEQVNHQAESEYGPGARVIEKGLPSVSDAFRIARVQFDGVALGTPQHTYLYRVSVTREYEITVLAANEQEADEATQEIMPEDYDAKYPADEDWDLTQSSDPKAGSAHDAWVARRPK
jgi:hypothetical protein